MNNKAAQIIKYTLSFILAGVLVYIAFRGIKWDEFWEGLKQTRWTWIVLYFVVAIAAVVFRMLRWKEMLEPIDPDIKKIDTWDAANVGNLTNVALPGAGEIVRCGYLKSKKAGFDKIFGTIMLERVWDVLAIACLFIGALAMKWDKFGTFFKTQIVDPVAGGVNFSIWWIVLIAVAVIALLLWAVFHFRGRSAFCAKIADFLSGIGAGFASFHRMKNKGLFLLYTVGIWTMYLLMSFFVLKAIPDVAGLNIVDALFLSAVGNISSVIPVPGGIGAYHYLVALSLSSLYAVTWESGILFATLCHESHAILIIVLGVISYFRFTLRKKGKEA